MLSEIRDLLTKELESEEKLPSDLVADMRLLLENLEMTVGPTAAVEEVPTPPILPPGPQEPAPQAVVSGGVGISQEPGGRFQVRAKLAHHEGYARTLQDMLAVLSGHPITGISAVLFELAARVQIMETRNSALTEELHKREVEAIALDAARRDLPEP